jgi:hypothetical protein
MERWGFGILIHYSTSCQSEGRIVGRVVKLGTYLNRTLHPYGLLTHRTDYHMGFMKEQQPPKKE